MHYLFFSVIALIVVLGFILAMFTERPENISKY